MPEMHGLRIRDLGKMGLSEVYPFGDRLSPFGHRCDRRPDSGSWPAHGSVGTGLPACALDTATARIPDTSAQRNNDRLPVRLQVTELRLLGALRARGSVGYPERTLTTLASLGAPAPTVIRPRWSRLRSRLRMNLNPALSPQPADSGANSG